MAMVGLLETVQGWVGEKNQKSAVSINFTQLSFYQQLQIPYVDQL